jgi:hypothetical protein
VPSTGKLVLVVDPFSDEREMYAEFFARPATRWKRAGTPTQLFT